VSLPVLVLGGVAVVAAAAMPKGTAARAHHHVAINARTLSFRSRAV
jgi:hypothetical protein